jgi:RND family efflux transporter MFP subunit
MAGLVILASAVALVAAWQWNARHALQGADPTRARKAGKGIPVRTVMAEQRDLEETIGGTAVTAPAQTATITIPTTAFRAADREVTRVNSWPGSQVAKGETLLEFDAALFSQVVQEREAVLAKMEEELATMEKLYAQRAASGLQVKAAQVAVTSARLELGLARRDLDLCEITSPIDGVVEDMVVVPQMRLRGDAELAVIHQLDPIHVEMDFPMERMDSLHIGQSASISLDAFPQETFEGKVVRIAPVVSTKTRVLPVTIEVSNPQYRIRAGISGYARVTNSKPRATTVPTAAVIRKQHNAMVVRINDQLASFQQVRTGPIVQAGYIEVLDGLNSGDEIVVFGQDAIEVNDLVDVDWRQWSLRGDLADALK